MIIHSIPQEMSPPKDVAMAAYVNAFKGKLVFNVRNKNPSSLFESQNMTIDLDEAMRDNSINMLQIEDELPPSSESIPHHEEIMS